MFATLIALALAAAPIGPLAVVKSADAEVQKLLSAPDATTEKLAARADEFVDFAELAKRAMGAEWAKLNKKQQDEFSATMKGLLRASYAQKAVVGSKDGAARVEYGDEKVEGNEAVVATKMTMKKDVISVVYKLFRADPKGSWRVYDVVTEEQSLVGTYSDQFRTVMGKKGFDGLLKSLQTRRDSLEKENAEKSVAQKETK